MSRQSEHWTVLKKFAWERADGRCERCDEPLIKGACHLHHLTYERRGRERLEDVKYLCLACHGAMHPRHTFRSVGDQRRLAAARRPKRKWVAGRGAALVEAFERCASEPPITEAEIYARRRKEWAAERAKAQAEREAATVA